MKTTLARPPFEGCENSKSNDLASQRTWVPHISLVFREMWDSTALTPKLLTRNPQFEVNIRQSHISRKTSEMWGTHGRGGAKY